MWALAPTLSRSFSRAQEKALALPALVNLARPCAARSACIARRCIFMLQQRGRAGPPFEPRSLAIITMRHDGQNQPTPGAAHSWSVDAGGRADRCLTRT